MHPRIALIAPSTENAGGQSVQARAIYDGLRLDGYDVSVIRTDALFPPGLRWARRYPYVRTLMNQLAYVISLLRARRADVLHVFSASYWSFLLAPVPAILAGRMFRKRVVLHYHSGEAEDHLSRWGCLVHPWLRRADVIAVPSEYLREVFRHHGYQVCVVPNVVDTSRFQFRVRTPLRPALLSTRNFEAHYRIEDTLRAFAMVKPRYPAASLTVAGSGSQEQRIRELAAALVNGSVHFAGRVEPAQMPSLYDRADIFVNSSVVDNQPVSILEAFAAGLPVISTAVGDVRSFVRDGETGILIPSQKPAAMAEAVAALLDDPGRAAQMAVRAREDVQRYTWSNVRAQWQGVYRDA